jgi:hypothetical protein
MVYVQSPCNALVNNTPPASSNTQNDAWKIGMRRVDKIVQAESQKGFVAVPTGMYSKDVDIYVYYQNTIIRVYECTNYGDPKFYIHISRAERYKRNLLNWQDVERILVCSFDDNLRYLPGKKAYFTDVGIKVIVKGYQD